MGRLKRFENWPERLNQYIADCQQKQFSWGEFDCALFTAGAIKAMTGLDLIRKLDLNYHSVYGANLITKPFGGLLELANTVAKQCAFSKQKISLAKRGDAVTTQTQLGMALGICLGQHAAFPNQLGLIFKPTKNSACSWRI